MFKYPSVKPHSKILSVKYKSQFMEILSKQRTYSLQNGYTDCWNNSIMEKQYFILNINGQSC